MVMDEFSPAGESTTEQFVCTPIIPEKNPYQLEGMVGEALLAFRERGIFHDLRSFYMEHTADYEVSGDAGAIVQKTYQDFYGDYLEHLETEKSKSMTGARTYQPMIDTLAVENRPHVLLAYYRLCMTDQIDYNRIHLITSKQQFHDGGFPQPTEIQRCALFLTSEIPVSRGAIPNGSNPTY